MEVTVVTVVKVVVMGGDGFGVAGENDNNLPQVVGWLLIWQATTVSHLYVARAITGIGIGAGVPIASIYMREISTPELRGTLVILMPAAANTGNLLMYILGWAMPWRLTCLPGAAIPLLPILLVFLLPETPSWLLSRGRREHLALLRGAGWDGHQDPSSKPSAKDHGSVRRKKTSTLQLSLTKKLSSTLKLLFQ